MCNERRDKIPGNENNVKMFVFMYNTTNIAH